MKVKALNYLRIFDIPPARPERLKSEAEKLLQEGTILIATDLS